MSSIKINDILKSEEEVKTKKLSSKAIDSYLKKIKAKQDFILSLKQIDEKNLRSVVQL